MNSSSAARYSAAARRPIGRSRAGVSGRGRAESVTVAPGGVVDVVRPGVLQHIAEIDSGILRGYTLAIADAMNGRPLTLADRDRLISRGMHLGLRRFDANLVVASVESRVKVTPGVAYPQTFNPPLTQIIEQPRKLPRWAVLATVLTAEAAIVIAIVSLLW